MSDPNTKDTNPKDALGIRKPSLWVVPAVAMYWLGMAMRNGGVKYGPYNWREKKVKASVYYDAKMRHSNIWFHGGEELASDSLVHHLGHDMACSAILLDAIYTGNLVDDRPKDPNFVKFLEERTQQIEAEMARAGS